MKKNLHTKYLEAVRKELKACSTATLPFEKYNERQRICRERYPDIDPADANSILLSLLDEDQKAEFTKIKDSIEGEQ